MSETWITSSQDHLQSRRAATHFFPDPKLIMYHQLLMQPHQYHPMSGVEGKLSFPPSAMWGGGIVMQQCKFWSSPTIVFILQVALSLTNSKYSRVQGGCYLGRWHHQWPKFTKSWYCWIISSSYISFNVDYHAECNEANNIELYLFYQGYNHKSSGGGNGTSPHRQYGRRPPACVMQTLMMPLGLN